MRRAFVRLWEGARADRVLSATEEAGPQADAPVADTGNTGNVRLRAGGTPDPTEGLDITLQTGGNITGYSDGINGTPGATFIQRRQGTTPFYGYTGPQFLKFAAQIETSDAVDDHPGISTPRTLADGRLAAVWMERSGLPIGTVRFAYKSAPRDAWTLGAAIDIGAEADSSPALIVLPSGRLLCYYIHESLVVKAAYSDDNGANWSTWSDDTLASAQGTGWHVSAEVVGDEIMVLISTMPGTASADARIYWSADRGQNFGLADTPAWSGVRTCVTKTGQVLAVTTNQSLTTGLLFAILPGGGGSPVYTTGWDMLADPDDPVFAICCMDDGTLWAVAGDGVQPAPHLVAQFSRDHGATWHAAGTTTQSTAEYIWRLGIDETTPYGLRSIGVGEWRGSMVVLGVTDGPTAANDEALVELHFGGWDQLSYRYMAAEDSDPNGFGGDNGCWIPIDKPDNLGWTLTTTGGGAPTRTIVNDGLHIVADATGNDMHVASTFFAPINTENSWRLRYTFYVAADGSIADNRATVRFRPRSDSTPHYAEIRVRHATDQIRVLDSAGTLATTVSVAGKFNDLTEVLIFVYAAQATPRASVYYRVIRGANATDAWTELVANVALTETAATPQGPAFGGTDAADVDWTVCSMELSEGSFGYEAGFTNPNDLAGRALEAAYDVYAADGFRIGGAGGGGVVGDDYTVSVGAAYSRTWLWRDLRPSAQHRSINDNGTHSIVFDADPQNSIAGEWVGLIGTNMRTATWQMNGTNSWGSPALSVNLDATLYAGTVSSIKSGLGFVGVDGAPWVPGQWRSVTGARVFVQVGSDHYEVTDNDDDRLYVDGVDFSAASGTLYVYGDRMGARLPAGARYRYARALVSAQVTADGDYRFGTPWIGFVVEMVVPYANGFTWSDPDATQVYEGERGYGIRFEAGPMRRELRIAWDPIDRLTSAQVQWLRELWRALRGRARPVALVDLDSRTDWGLYTLAGPLAVENVYGEGRDALDRISQLTLRSLL